MFRSPEQQQQQRSHNESTVTPSFSLKPTIEALSDQLLTHLNWSSNRPCLHFNQPRLRFGRHRTAPKPLQPCLAKSISAQCVPSAISRLIRHVLATNDYRVTMRETMALVVDVLWIGSCEKHSKVKEGDTKGPREMLEKENASCINRIVEAVQEVLAATMPPPATLTAPATESPAQSSKMEQIKVLADYARSFREETLQAMETERLEKRAATGTAPVAEHAAEDGEQQQQDEEEALFDFNAAASDGMAFWDGST